MEVEGDAISAYGAVDAEPVSHNGGKGRLFRIRNMVEKAEGVRSAFQSRDHRTICA